MKERDANKQTRLGSSSSCPLGFWFLSSFLCWKKPPGSPLAKKKCSLQTKWKEVGFTNLKSWRKDLAKLGLKVLSRKYYPSRHLEYQVASLSSQRRLQKGTFEAEKQQFNNEHSDLCVQSLLEWVSAFGGSVMILNAGVLLWFSQRVGIICNRYLSCLSETPLRNVKS